MRKKILFFMLVFLKHSGSFSDQMLIFSNNSINFLWCLNKITDSIVIHNSVIFFQEELTKIIWANLLLKIIKKPKQIIQKKNSRNLPGFYILFPHFHKSYKTLFSNHVHSKSVFFLIWESIPSENEIILIFKEYWFHNYINVIGLVNNKTSCKFYTFYPFIENQCGFVGKPILVDEWTISNRINIQNSSWFPRKITNFKGCQLKAIGNHQPPDNIMKFNGIWRADGVASKILKTAEKYLNFTSIIISPNLNVSLDHMWYYFDKELKFISDAVYRKKVDLAFGWYSYASIEIDNLDLTMELGRVSSIDCFGWAVPYRAGARPPNVTYFINEFGLITWFLILGVFFIVSVIFYLNLNRRYIISMFLVYQIFLEQSIIHKRSSRTSYKIIFINFCFYGLVMSAAYKASFGSFITVPSHGREFKSVHDILNSSLKIYGSPEMLKILNITTADSKLGKIMKDRFHILKPCNYVEVMMQLIRKRNIAILGVKRSLYFYSISEAKRIKVKIPFRFIPGCLIRPHTTHFMFRRGSPLIDPFNTVLNRLFESGISQYWILHLGSNKILPIERLKGRVIRLNFIKEPLIILIMGYVVSSLVFMGEIIMHRYDKNVKKKK